MCTLECLPAGDKRKAAAAPCTTQAHMCEHRGDFKRRRKTAESPGAHGYYVHPAPAPDMVAARLNSLEDASLDVTAEIHRLQTQVDNADTTALPSRMLEFHAMLTTAAKDQRGSSHRVCALPSTSNNNGAHGFAAASTSTGCALANKRTKVGRNAIEKQLLARLDACIPAEFRSAAQRKCAGKRSVGASGRSTIDILRDSVRSVAAALRSGCASSSESSFSRRASSGTTTDSDACMPSVCVDDIWPMRYSLPDQEALFSAENFSVAESPRPHTEAKYFVEPEMGEAGVVPWSLPRCVSTALFNAHESAQQDFKVSLDEAHISWLGSFADEELTVTLCSSDSCCAP